MAQERKLGRGFDDLAAQDMTFASEEVLQLAVSSVKPNRFQPRQGMGGEAFQNLKASIARDGLLQPIVVRPSQDGYELIAGERRWRAAAELGLEVIPAIVRQADDQHALELALVENIQREDLNPIDRAMSFKQLMTAFNLTQEEASARVGQERSTVANTIRLLDLPKEVQALVRNESISMGHARALLALKSAELMLEISKKIISDGLSVRQVEEMTSPRRPGRPRVRRPKAADTLALEDRLRAHLATKVEVNHGRRRGRIIIEYYSSRDLDRILERLGL